MEKGQRLSCDSLYKAYSIFSIYPANNSRYLESYVGAYPIFYKYKYLFFNTVQKC